MRLGDALADHRILRGAVFSWRWRISSFEFVLEQHLLPQRRHTALEAEQCHRRSSSHHRACRRMSPASQTASSKNTSLNSEVPVICSIGRTVIPGCSSPDQEETQTSVCATASPDRCVRSRSTKCDFVRQRSPDLLPVHAASLLRVASKRALRLYVRQIGAGAGLGVTLAPQFGPVATIPASRYFALLVVVAERDDRRARQPFADMPHVRPGHRHVRIPRGRSPAARSMQPRPPYSLRPADAGPAALRPGFCSQRLRSCGYMCSSPGPPRYFGCSNSPHQVGAFNQVGNFLAEAARLPR
jgi:hypothetical protein